MTSQQKLAAFERLYRLAPKGALLGLSRMRAAIVAMERPDERFQAVHVAGTNGKGSVSAMTAAMVNGAGLRAGLYTSPHLCRFNERIQIAGVPADDALLYGTLEEVLDRAPELTFFEATTLTAFSVFARAGVDVAVIEVGLGGRLDATNVLSHPRATAITNIALDHTDRLGTSIRAIAQEKAGIAKAGVPMFTGPLVPDAWEVVDAVTREVGAPLFPTAGEPKLESLVEHYPPALPGAHQRDNAKVAAALGQALGLTEEAIGIGLTRTHWPGRLETIASRDGEVLLDAAHNPDGARALAAHLATRGLPPERVSLIFGAMADKDHALMLATLAPCAAHRVYVIPDGRKAAEPHALAAQVSGTVADDVGQALTVGRREVGSSGLVVVAGSIFLVGAARAHLLGLDRDPAVAL